MVLSRPLAGFQSTPRGVGYGACHAERVTNVRMNFRPEGARLVIDAGLHIAFRLQSLPQESDLIDLTPGTSGRSHPMGPKLWNL